MNEHEEARQVALHFLDYQPRTSAEVRRRLARAGYEDELADEVVADLQRAGLLDDEQFSRAWVEDRAERKGYGRARLAAELRIRGVGREIVDDALAALDPEGQREAAAHLAEHKLGGQDPADPAVRRRLAGFLQRRGYDMETIRAVLQGLAPTDAD